MSFLWVTGRTHLEGSDGGAYTDLYCPRLHPQYAAAGKSLSHLDYMHIDLSQVTPTV